MIHSQILQKFTEASLAAFPELKDKQDIPFEVTQSTQEKFGHYQFNSAMKLTKLLGLPPRQIAEKIVANVDKDGMIEKLEIAGPGFVNITLSPKYLSQKVDSIITEPHLGISLPKTPLRIVIDFSSPNVAKEMHVGHLRSTIIGDCLANLFEFLGHDVLRINHIGDWGTAFGMLIAYIKKNVPAVINGESEASLPQLVGWYRAAKKEFDEDPDFKKASQLEVVALQKGQPESLRGWEIICEISRKAYQEIYDLLGVTLIERGESYYNPVLAATVAELEKKNLITLSEGAKCVFVEEFSNREGNPMPFMVQKSDGGYNYDTTDLATIRQRIDEEKADRLIYVTDAGQALHFQLVFRVAEMAGYLDRAKIKVDHVPFGLVLGNDGKKFRTRSGETERLIDLLTAATDFAEKILIERSPELPIDERQKLADALGIGAIKYADLSSHRVSDYVFSYDKMLRFEGNTAAYLMYSYVRIAGIKRKVDVNVDSLIGSEHITLEHPSEVALALQILQFDETLNLLADELMPHRLTDYLYNLADKFNAFFRDCRVEGSEFQSSRLLLCEAAARTMKQGLEILGLKVVDKM
ncbi:MAG: arginine--tRNA ligase [Parachlamydiaceae bacterium]|nr:arginine--tRNA ligase [Parachlamydiaceae bacterium]